MEIIQNFFIALNGFILEGVKFFLPHATLEEAMFIVIFICAVLALCLALYGRIARPYDEGDMESSFAKGRREGVHQGTLTMQSTVNSLEKQITTLQKQNVAQDKALAEKDEYISKLKVAAKQVLKDTDNSYQHERIIASLAVELEGYAEIEDRAARIVEVLS